MNEKHPKLTRILPVQRRPLFDTVLLAVISAAVFFLLPLAQYTYSKTTYGLTGLRFLTGTYVMGGTVYIAPVPMLFVFLALFLATLLIGLFFGKMKPSAGGVALLVAGLLQMAMAVLTNTQIENIMPGVKKVSSGLGLTVLMFLGVILMIRGFYTLFQLGSINALDFMVLPAGIYLLINNYFPMVGMFIAFKNIDYRVGILSSPWCGFDNFKYLFNTTDAWVITRNTLAYNFVFIITSNILGVIIGLFLHRVLHRRMQKLFQTTILLPQLIGLYYLTNTELYSLQVMLNSILLNAQALSAMGGGAATAMALPSTTVRMAIAVIGVIPVMALYPFFQKYFVKGIMLGGVKE